MNTPPSVTSTKEVSLCLKSVQKVKASFVLPSAEASIAFVWTSAYAGAQTFAVCGALPHTLFFLNFLITPPFWYSYSLPFSVLCVAE